MDIDVSQIGQNVAFKIPEQPVQQAENRENAVATQQSAENVPVSDQENRNSADNSSERGSSQSPAQPLDVAVEQVSEFVQQSSRDLSFSIDEESKQQVVVVTDSESGEVIRQIPSEEVLALAERIKELQSDVGSAVGVLFSKEV